MCLSWGELGRSCGILRNLLSRHGLVAGIDVERLAVDALGLL